MRRFSNTLQLRLVLLLFFLALTLPTTILVRQAYSQLKWEAFYQYRNLAEELSSRVNNRFNQLISEEESRAFADYSFLVVSGAPEANFLQPSPLSRFPVESAIPGLIGYFQLNAQGHFSTPLLPQPASQASIYGVSAAQLSQRQQLQRQIQRVLSDNQLVQPRQSVERDRPGLAGSVSSSEPQRLAAQRSEQEQSKISVDRMDQGASVVLEETVVAEATTEPLENRETKFVQQQKPASFERLKGKRTPEKQQKKLDTLSDYGRVEDLNLASPYDDQQPQTPSYTSNPKKRAVRKEQSALPVVQTPLTPQRANRDGEAVGSASSTQVNITMFESEIDPFDFALMDSGHFVMYRNVWRNGQRDIQGAIIEQQPFLQGVIKPMFHETGLSQMSDLMVAYQANVFSVFGGVSTRDYLNPNNTTGGELLYQSRLSAPFSDFELIYSINHLPAGQGATVIAWAVLILAIVLLGGLLLMYRLGLRQIALSQQQQDFVSSVSHELKTPLTSIRMYSEILREGWADAEKRKSYYDFIFEESERLSRLIANVLQLARMNRNDIQLDLTPMTIHTLFDNIRSKLASLIESAGFEMTLDIDKPARDAVVQVDADCFTQILINLVDNAIKFSSKTNTKAVDITARLCDHDEVVISVRDYGPGVLKNQMQKIFRLFYRSETELTRETVGTGIGLALVHQLVQAMGGKVDVLNREPGAEFRITLTLA